MPATRIESGMERLASMPARERDRLIVAQARKHGLSPARLKALLLKQWAFVGRPKQQPPAEPWVFWWLLAGRGFGKTL